MGTDTAPFSTPAGLHCAEEVSELSPGLGLEWRVTSFGNALCLPTEININLLVFSVDSRHICSHGLLHVDQKGKTFFFLRVF